MKNNSGYTLIELVVSTAVILTLLVGGVSTLKSDSDIIKQAKQASSIAFDVNKGISSALLLKRTGGCLNGVSISHTDLLGVGVPRSSVYPIPWITNFSFSMRGGEPDVQGIRLRALRRVCGLDIVDADKANLLGRYAIQA